MLTLATPGGRMGRRDLLRIGALGLGGLSLPWLLRQQADAATRSFIRDKSVVFLFLHGGPSQFETFDPKMTAAANIRSQTGEIETAIPGVTFGSTFPLLAKLADKLAIVRSYRPGDADHDIKPIVCPETLDANLGALYARTAGANHPVTGMPRNMAVFPRAVKADAQPPLTNFGDFSSTGALPKALSPFILGGGGGQVQDNMRLDVPRGRLDDRRNLLGSLDRIRRAADASGQLDGMDRFQQQAFETIVGGAADAFDLTKEDPRVVERYDTFSLMTPDDISRAWNNHKWYTDNAQTLGKLLLLARRLCEAGCGFVTVTTGFVWDMHADENNAPMMEGMTYAGPPLDRAVSAFIEDVEARGLSDKITLVVCGEMGRTPSVNSKGGRDHWGNLGPLLVYGGGLKMGQVIGHSTRDGGEPASEPIRISNLIATIMHTLLDLGELRIAQGLPRDLVQAVTKSPPIEELV
jgi:hypothetical protein